MSASQGEALAGAAAPATAPGFPFQRSVLGEGSSEAIKISLNSNPVVLRAIQTDTPFPIDTAGFFPLGSVGFDWESSGPLRFALPQGGLGLELSASAQSGGGIYRNFSDALAATGWKEGAGEPAPAGSDLFLVLSSGFSLAAGAKFSYPVGVISSVGLGIAAAHQGGTGVIVRTPANVGAKTAMATAVTRWRLPRQILRADDLPPGTWVSSQVSGSISFELKARVGYDIAFLRELRLGGLSQNLSARLVSALRATASIRLAGDYLVVLGREDQSSKVRLQLYRSNEGTRSLGVDLIAELKQVDPPAKTSSLVQVVFGIHGLQILNDLEVLKQWKSGSGDLTSTPARLDRETALNLLTTASGIDARANFSAAWQKTTDALDGWRSLPPGVSGELWDYLESDSQSANLPSALTRLVSSTDADFRSSLQSAIASDPAQTTPFLRWSSALAGDSGLLSLLDQPSMLRAAAKQTLAALSDGTINRARGFIDAQMSLAALSQGDPGAAFGKLTAWVRARLGDCFNKELQIADIGDLQVAIQALQNTAPAIAGKSQSAFSQWLSSSVSATVQRSWKDTALLDASFDLALPAAEQAFRSVMDAGALDKVMTSSIDGVALHRGVLTHGISKSASIQLHLPFFDAKAEHVNQSLATLRVEENAGRVLVYQVEAGDKVSVSHRFESELAVLARLPDENKQTLADSKVAYRSRQTCRSLSRSEFENRTRPFLTSLIGGPFTNETVLSLFYEELAREAGANGSLGDVALDFQVELPGTVLAAWTQPRTDQERRAAVIAMSLSLQSRLKQLVPTFYFSDLKKLDANATAAALLAWSAIPPTTAVTATGGGAISWNLDRDVYWDWESAGLRHSVLYDGKTVAILKSVLAQAAERWQAAGDGKQAAFFAPDQAASFLRLADQGAGNSLLLSLLFTEAQLVRGAASAFESLKNASATASQTPALILKTLARFGADLSETFNRKLSIYSSPETLRTFNSLLIAESSRALSGARQADVPRALASFFFLKSDHSFKMDDFLNGDVPQSGDLRFARVVTNFAL